MRLLLIALYKYPYLLTYLPQPNEDNGEMRQMPQADILEIGMWSTWKLQISEPDSK